jgi:hypothetical protein
MPVMANAATSNTSNSNLPTPQKLSQLKAQVLSMVLAGKESQIDSLPQVIAVKEALKENPALAKEYLSNDCTNKIMSPLRTINTVINGLASRVQVYQDGSFTVAKIGVTRNGSNVPVVLNQSQNQSVTPQVSSGYTTFWSQNLSGLGGWDVWAWYEYSNGIYIDEYLELTTYFNNNSSDIEITGNSASGSWARFPINLNSTSCPTIANDSCDVIAEGDYILSSTIPIIAWTNSMRIELTKSSGSSSFTAYGEINNSNK